MLPGMMPSSPSPARIAREQYRLAVVHLALHVVVVAVDRSAGNAEGRQVPPHRVEDEVHHLRAVRARVVLRPAHRLDVVFEVLRSLGKVRQIPVG